MRRVACVSLLGVGIQLAGLEAARRKRSTASASVRPGDGARNSKPYFFEEGLVKAAESGAIIINEDGVENTYYLPGSNIIDGGKTVKYTPPYRFYLMKTPTTDYSNAGNFYKPILPGKTFTVDMNFGPNGPSCGCNLNFYLVDMPVPEAGKDQDHYCDAQCFPDMGCCEEFDMNEGNANVQQVTNHACTYDYGQHPDWACHKWGDPEVKTHGWDFGIGSGNTIDSTKAFTFSQRYDMQGNDMIVTTTMSQEGRNLVLKMGPGNAQLNAMAQVMLRGMAFVTGYWFASDMNWMDGEACGSGPQQCNMNPAYISNWRITSNDGSVPTPPTPTPGPGPSPSGGCCMFGSDCGDCGEDGSGWCHQSASNCAVCTGEFDASASAPRCDGTVPTLPTDPPGTKCCWGGGCTGCNEDPSNWCNGGKQECGNCGGTWC